MLRRGSQAIAAICMASLVSLCGARLPSAGVSTQVEGCNVLSQLLNVHTVADFVRLGIDEGWYEVTSLDGAWSEIFAYDNSQSNASVTHTEKYTVGFSETQSTTTTSSWSTSVGLEIKGITANAGYSKTIEQYDSSTWSASEEKTLSITVPAKSVVKFEQRILKVALKLKANTCTTELPWENFCFTALSDNSVDTKTCWRFAREPCQNVRDCGVSSVSGPGSIIAPVIGLGTTCYSSNPDAAKRDAFCPIPKKVSDIFTAPLRPASTTRDGVVV